MFNPPKSRPPKNCHIPLSLLCLIAQHPAPSCCRSRPLLPKIIGARGRSSPRRQSLGVDNPRLPVISWDCVPYRLRYGTVRYVLYYAQLSLCNPRLVGTCADPLVWPPAVHADALPRFRKLPGVPACGPANQLQGSRASYLLPTTLGIQRLDTAAYLLMDKAIRT